MKKVTIKDVAKEAGVSISTVSNALNNVSVLKPETKEHILNVAKELNYIPDLRGRNLKSSETKVIGFFTTNVNGPYFHSLVESMAKECERNGYALNIFVSKDKEIIMQHLFGGLIDGAVINSNESVKTKELDMIETQNIKTVFVDREIKSKNTSSVLFDSYEAGYEATSYLLNMGHKDIVFIRGPLENHGSTQRQNGYIDAMKEANIQIDNNHILEGFYEKSGGFNAVKSYIRRNSRRVPDAFLAGNDLSAMGCIEALESEGFVVPRDVSVMGFDDIEISKYYNPKLTTVQNPITRLGVVVIQEVIRLIKENKEGNIYKIPGKIIARDSSIVRVN